MVRSTLRALAAASRGSLPVFWSVLAVAGLLAGCESSDPINTQSNPVVATNANDKSGLIQSIDMLQRLAEFEQREAHRNILTRLQEWIAQQTPAPQWSPDPLSQSLPENLLTMTAPQRLQELTLEPYDVLVLQEAIWLRDIARHVVSRSVLTPDLTAAVDATLADNPAGQAQLRQAVQLFDWTMINLQTDDDIETGATHRFHSDLLLYPWESLLLGRGTVEEKSHVFLLLARQLGLRVVLVALPSEGAELPEPPRVWLPALLVGDQLYLLDMRLGSPLLTKDGTKIATLAEVTADPTLVTQLANEDDTTYPISADQLAGLIGLVDASPAELSLRMKTIEEALTGDSRLVLTVTPTTLANDLRACAGIHDVQLAQLPYLTFARRGLLKSNPEAVQALSLEHSLFDSSRTPLLQARLLHFRGQFEDTDDESGAIAIYLTARTPDEAIANLANSPVPAATAGAPTRDEIEAHNARVEFAQRLMRRVKQNASFWLGTLAFEQANYHVAIDYLDKRLLTLDPQTSWSDGAHFAIGRAYEAMSRKEAGTDSWQKAIAMYEQVPAASPYRIACQWRVARLKARSAAPDVPTSAASFPGE